MRLLYIIFLLLCMVSTSGAGGLLNSYQFDAAGDTSCDNLGSWGIYYDVDHTDGTTTACVQAGTDTTTFVGVTADASVNTTVGGTYGVLWDGTCNKYVEVPATDITPLNGRIELKFHTTAALGTNDTSVLEWGSSGSRVYLKLDYVSAGEFRVIGYHDDGTLTNINTSTETITTSSSYVITFDWNSTTGEVEVSFAGSAVASTSGGTVGTFTTPSNGVYFGDLLVNACFGVGTGYGFDDIYMGASEQ